MRFDRLTCILLYSLFTVAAAHITFSANTHDTHKHDERLPKHALWWETASDPIHRRKIPSISQHVSRRVVTETNVFCLAEDISNAKAFVRLGTACLAVDVKKKIRGRRVADTAQQCSRESAREAQSSQGIRREETQQEARC